MGISQSVDKRQKFKNIEKNLEYESQNYLYTEMDTQHYTLINIKYNHNNTENNLEEIALKVACTQLNSIVCVKKQYSLTPIQINTDDDNYNLLTYEMPRKMDLIYDIKIVNNIDDNNEIQYELNNIIIKKLNYKHVFFGLLNCLNEKLPLIIKCDKKDTHYFNPLNVILKIGFCSSDLRKDLVL